MANTYSRNRDSIITAALRKIGVVAQGDIPEPEQISEGAEALEDYLKHMQASTELRWNLEDRAEDIASGDSVTVLTDSDDIIDVYNLTISNVDDQGNPSGDTVPVALVDSNFFSRHYHPDTDGVTGMPTVALAQFTRNIDTDTGEPAPTVEITLYPTPNQAYFLTYKALVKAQNAGIGVDTLNVDEMWLRVVKYGLACDLADEYSIDLSRAQRLEAKYASLLLEAQRKSRNTKDTFFIYPV